MGELFHAFGIEWQVLLAQAVNFGIVLAALTYFLYKPILKLLSERQEKIAKGVRDAEEAAEERGRIESEKAGIISGAQKEAESIVGRAVVEGKEERETIVGNAQVRADSIVKDAEAQAAEMKRGALAESEAEIARVAVLAAEKILRKS